MVKNVTLTSEDIGSDYKSIKSLLKKLNEIETERCGITKLNIHIDADLDESNQLSLAIIWRYALVFRELDCDKEITYSRSNISFFEKTHFLDRLTGKENQNTNPNIPIHFESFSTLKQNNNESERTIEAIFSNKVKPILNEDKEFHKEVRIQILEILDNAFNHSNSQNDAGAVCATKQNKKTDTLSFCVIDMGQGVKQSFLTNPALKEKYNSSSDEDMIFEATKFRVSCNPDTNPKPNYNHSNGGIGLYFLKEFIKTHKGSSLVIVSNKGYYYIDSEKREKKRNFVDTTWPGTVVYFRTQLADSKSSEYKAVVQKYLDTIDNEYLNIV